MSAVISDCGLYRYMLSREVRNSGIVIAYFGINCSTADANIDDQTVKKWRGFSERNNARKFIVGNPFAFRCTDVKGLAKCADPVGSDNRFWIGRIIEQADLLVPCWGNLGKIPKQIRFHVRSLKDRILTSGKPVKIFGTTKSGDPKHPLMLGYNTDLVEWL